jgi:NAD-dependent SIR2 family protein deacetylase
MQELEYKPGNGVYYNNLDPDEAWHPGCLIWARRDWKCRDGGRDLTLCKLHGSFRWLQCRDCANVYSVDYWGAQPLGDFLGYSASPIRSHAFFCWNRECLYTPLTVALFPDNRKHFDVENSVLEQTWSTAIHAARRCKDLIVVGSALRDSDHDLLRLVHIAAAQARRLIVVNPAEADMRRTESLLGMPAKWFPTLGEFNESLK